MSLIDHLTMMQIFLWVMLVLLFLRTPMKVDRHLVELWIVTLIEVVILIVLIIQVNIAETKI